MTLNVGDGRFRRRAMHLNGRTGGDVEGLPCPDQSRDPQAMDRRQLAGRAMNDQVHARLIALEFKNSANNQLLRGTYLRRPGAVRRGISTGHSALPWRERAVLRRYRLR